MTKSILQACKNCGKERLVRLEKGEPRALFCSRHCNVDYKRKNLSSGIIKSAWEIGKKGRSPYLWYACIKCGKERWVAYDSQTQRGKRLTCDYCSRHRTGVDNGNWKGGKTYHPLGYVLCRLSSDDFFHPMVAKSGYVLEHRLVMAQHLGRCLLSWEVVHHKNGIRDDNRIENLEILSSQAIHTVDMQLKRYIKRMEKRILVLQNENKLLKEQKEVSSEIVKETIT